jgi:hypothetical protein
MTAMYLDGLGILLTVYSSVAWLLAIQRVIAVSQHQRNSAISLSVSHKYLSGGLQDMGEEYTEAELGLTSCYLDPDNLGTVDFADFVRWWCE